MALLDNNKDILPLSSIAELLSAKVRTLKMYQEKGLFPVKKDIKKLYSINDVQIISFVHYLASFKNINANGIKYIISMLDNNMDSKNREDFLNLIDQKLEKLSGKEVVDVETM